MGADRTVASSAALLPLQPWGPGAWRPPIVKRYATTGKGVAALVAAIDAFREHSRGSAGERRRARAEWRVRELIAQRFLQRVEREVLAPGELDRLLDRIAAREADPYTVVDEIMRRALEQNSG